MQELRRTYQKKWVIGNCELKGYHKDKGELGREEKREEDIAKTRMRERESVEKNDERTVEKQAPMCPTVT